MSIRATLILSIAAGVALAATPDLAEAQGRGNAQARGGGPPFCENGNGHPVHGWRWCAEKGYGSGGFGIFDERRVDDRGSITRDGRNRNDGLYDSNHAEFHLYLDRKYNQLAAQRPLDIAYQLRLRQQKQSEHDEWHRRTGIRHE